ncbi:hypothetical protein SAMN02787142_8283 [Burkholderia sp. WP9]|nr:hypothetical protein SAMN02787142_8283 [Burkholderia sp. WP9]
MSPFDNPTEFAEAAAVFGAAPGNDRSNATLAKSAAMRVGVVAAVGVDDLGLAKRSAAHASNRRDGVDQRQQLRDIVAIRAGQDDADRNAVRVYEDVVFRSWSCAIGGVWPSFWPAIKHSPGLHGYPGPTWTISQLREMIFQRLGVRFSAVHVGHLVRSYGLAYRLGYSPTSKSSRNTSQRSQTGVWASRWALAAKMLMNGDSVELVAKTLNIGVPTIRKYRSLVRAGQLDAIEQ